MKIQSCYLRPVFTPEQYRRVITKLHKAVKAQQEITKFEAIAFRGVSGAALAFPLSYRMRIPLLCVRKQDSERSHSYCAVEGRMDVSRYCIVDDCIASGATVDEIVEAVSKESRYHNYKGEATLTDVFLMNQEDDNNVWRYSADKRPGVKFHIVRKQGDL